MPVIIRLQNLPLTASAMDVRVFFHGLSIPDGGVHIVGGNDGDAFIAFSSDEDARQAMNLSGHQLKDCTIKLLLSSRNEMFKVIEQARIAAAGGDDHSPALSRGIPISPTESHQNPTIGSSIIESSAGMNSSGSNNIIDQSASNLNPVSISNNALPNVSMAMAGFPPGINLSLPNSMMHLQNMKLTPQQISSLMSGSPMPGLLQPVPTQLSQNPNPFMLPNIGFPTAAAGAPSQLLSSNPLGLPGILPGMIPPSVMSTMLNQQPQPALGSANTPQQVGLGNLPSPFNSTASGIRVGGPNQMVSNPHQNPTFNPSIMQGGGQRNSQNGNAAQGRQEQDNFNSRDRFNPNDMPKPLGPPFRQNPTPLIEQTRDRGLIHIRDRITDSNQIVERIRDRDIVEERDRPNSGRRRTPDNIDKRNEGKRRRSRSRSRERIRREGKRSRSRSRSRSDRLERPTSARRNSNRSESLVPEEVRDTSGEPDLIIDEIIEPSACIMLSNVSNDASYRDVREFLRAEVRRYGIMRDYEKGTACIRLDNPIELNQVLRRNGEKLHGKSVRIEVVPLEVFQREGRKHGEPIEYKRENNRARKESGDRPRDFGGRDRDRERERGHRHQSRGECCLIIKGLPVNYSGLDVANITLAGVIKSHYSDIHIHEEQIDRHGRQFATAYVKFHSVPEAELAAELISETQGDHLRARVSGIEELQEIRESVAPPPRPIIDAKPLFDLNLDESCNVMLKGVPLNMTERDVFDFFSDVGLSPQRVKMLTDAQTGNRINKVICEFNDVSQARRALAKDTQFFGRSAIGVHMLPRREGGGPHGRGGRGGSFAPRPVFPHQNSRFQPPHQIQSENPFEQAWNASAGMPIPHNEPMRGHMRGGMRGRGLSRGRGSARPSHFAPADSTTSENSHVTENPPSHFERKGCVLALTNIPFSASMDQIIIFLEETIGKEVPHDRIIRRYNEFQKPTGDARVAFDSHYETKQAFERLKGSRMWGRLLEVSFLADY